LKILRLVEATIGSLHGDGAAATAASSAPGDIASAATDAQATDAESDEYDPSAYIDMILAEETTQVKWYMKWLLG
jgi:hypothetical protein